MKKIPVLCAAALCCLLLLCSCAGSSGEQVQTQPVPASAYLEEIPVETVDPALEAEALAQLPLPPVAVTTETFPDPEQVVADPVLLVPDAPGEMEERCDVAVIDYSHPQEGYVMAQYFGQTDSRLKVLVKGPSTTYSYNLPVGQWTVFPLSDGNGTYQVGIYQNVSGTRYATVMSVTLEVTLLDEFAPFLRPNQYVNYSEATEAVALGAQLMAGLEQPLEKVAAVYDYVVSNLSYDYDKAATVKSGYLPDLNQVLADKKGICFDYASLMTAMLRSQGIPCKLVVGYAGKTYHAWISVWTEEHGWVDGAIFFDGHVWKRMDPTFASSSHRSQEIMDFIENGDYTVKYLY